MDELHDVVVVGGGLAGLTAAATAASAGRSVLLLDGHAGANRATTDQVGRFRFNRGGHALYRRGAGRAVLRRLGVAVSGKMPPLWGAMGRRGDLVAPLPMTPRSMIGNELVTGGEVARIFRLAGGMVSWRPERLADRSAAVWFDELGLDGGPRELAEMLTRTSTYAADLDRVSADVVASQVRMALTSNVLYLHGGWSTLLDGLAAVGRRHGVEREPAAARAVVPDGGRVRVAVEGAGERVVLARSVVVAAGSPSACTAVLPTRPAAWDDLAGPVRVACLDIGLAAQPPTAVLLGLDRPLYLIRHSPPAELAPPGGAVVHGLRYVHEDETTSAADLRRELEAHARLAGVDVEAAEEVRYLHNMAASSTMPTPATGGLAGRPAVADTGLDGVLVAGDWVGPTGYLADASLASGEAAGRLAAERSAPAPTGAGSSSMPAPSAPVAHG